MQGNGETDNRGGTGCYYGECWAAPAVTTVSAGRQGATTTVNAGRQRATTVNAGRRGATTTVSAGRQGATTTVSSGRQRATTTVSAGRQRATTTVSAGRQGATTTVSSGRQGATTTVSAGRQGATTTVSVLGILALRPQCVLTEPSTWPSWWWECRGQTQPIKPDAPLHTSFDFLLTARCPQGTYEYGDYCYRNVSRLLTYEQAAMVTSNTAKTIQFDCVFNGYDGWRN